MAMDHAMPDVLPVHWPPGTTTPPAATLAALDRAVTVLRDGGLVAIPTETVYGLAGLALADGAVERIFLAKGRATTNPLIVHVDGIAMARTLASEWPDAAERIARACWPGPTTVVVPKAPSVPDAVTASGPTVAIRCPDQPITRLLITRLGQPLAAPSANRSLRLSPTTAAHVLEGLGARVDLILDAGPCGRGIESTVVDCTVSPPTILRPGPLTASALAAVVGAAPEGLGSAPPPAEGPARAPGQATRHYAPRTPLEVSASAAERVEALLAEGRRSRAGSASTIPISPARLPTSSPRPPPEPSAARPRRRPPRAGRSRPPGTAHASWSSSGGGPCAAARVRRSRMACQASVSGGASTTMTSSDRLSTAWSMA